MSAKRAAAALLVALLTLTAAQRSAASDDPGRGNGDTGAESLAMKLQNPIASLISVPLQNNFEWGAGTSSDGFRYLINVQPVIPISISDNWNIISRTIVPIIHQSDVISGTTQSGMGDILQSAFISPKAPGPGGIVWGAGPVFLLPTTTERGLGAEKFGLGPTMVGLRQSGGWTYGALANHLVSIGGTSNLPDVNATFLQPFLSYTSKTLLTVGVNTEASYDWENTKWTVPLNAFLSQLVKLGAQPVQFSLGPKFVAEGPTGAPDWGIRFTVTFLFPK